MTCEYNAMKPDPVKVIFREDEDGEPVAFFPEYAWNNQGDLTCYAHVGQHSAADIEYYRECTFPPRFAEKKAALRAELESLGYVIEERKRITPAMNLERLAR